MIRILLKRMMQTRWSRSRLYLSRCRHPGELRHSALRACRDTLKEHAIGCTGRDSLKRSTLLFMVQMIIRMTIHHVVIGSIISPGAQGCCPDVKVSAYRSTSRSPFIRMQASVRMILQLAHLVSILPIMATSMPMARRALTPECSPTCSCVRLREISATHMSPAGLVVQCGIRRISKRVWLKCRPL